MERLVAILEENKKKREKISIIPRGNLPTGGIFIGNNWIVIRIRLGGEGENFDEFRSDAYGSPAFRYFKRATADFLCFHEY